MLLSHCRFRFLTFFSWADTFPSTCPFDPTIRFPPIPIDLFPCHSWAFGFWFRFRDLGITREEKKIRVGVRIVSYMYNP
jgi:hypothetical protein